MAVVARRGEIQLVPRPRHRDIEQTALLLLVIVPGRKPILRQPRRELERIAALRHRKPALGAGADEHDPKFQPLRLVHGEDAHGVRGEVDFGSGRIVSGFEQQVDLVDEERHAVDREGLADGTDDPGPGRGAAQPATEETWLPLCPRFERLHREGDQASHPEQEPAEQQ